MYGALGDELRADLATTRRDGLEKRELVLASPQSRRVVVDGRELINFCTNNYLGLADDPEVIRAATEALQERGFGMASVRFICGTQDLHRKLERRLADFLGKEDAILFPSCFDANGGTFEVLFDDRDAIISDELNHASLIDGIRLSKAKRLRYRNADMKDLEEQLRATTNARRRCIVTDGVFSMDGYAAPLPQICDLADEYEALVLVDDSHAVGVMGAGGRGTPEHFGVADRVDILTGTLGKALGGAAGGYVSGRAELVEVLRQRARPYLFSNSVAPALVAGALTALDLAEGATVRRKALRSNTSVFRRRMSEAGFEILPGEHPITPVMFRGADGALSAARVAAKMLEQGVYVVPFTFPVVPRGSARIRVQLSSAHSLDDIDVCVKAFSEALQR